MCKMVDQEIKKGDNPQVLADLLRIIGEEEDSKWRPKDPQEIAGRIFHTAFVRTTAYFAPREIFMTPTHPHCEENANPVIVQMGMAKHSSLDTRARAQDLAASIGSYHLDFDIDTVVEAVITLFTAITTLLPKYKIYGGTTASNLALQNIQARLRMVLAYMFAQLLPTVRGRTELGSLLVLGSCNVDESLRGYFTKYDCSSADINPIGAISYVSATR